MLCCLVARLLDDHVFKDGMSGAEAEELCAETDKRRIFKLGCGRWRSPYCYLVALLSLEVIEWLGGDTLKVESHAEKDKRKHLETQG